MLTFNSIKNYLAASAIGSGLLSEANEYFARYTTTFFLQSPVYTGEFNFSPNVKLTTTTKSCWMTSDVALILGGVAGPLIYHVGCLIGNRLLGR